MSGDRLPEDHPTMRVSRALNRMPYSALLPGLPDVCDYTTGELNPEALAQALEGLQERLLRHAADDERRDADLQRLDRMVQGYADLQAEVARRLPSLESMPEVR